MFSKNTIPGAIIIALLIGAVTFGIGVYEKQDKFQLKNIPYQNVSYIEIINRGLPGKPVLFFRTRDSIIQICQQLKDAAPISVVSDSWKDSKGMCEIVLHFNDHKARPLTYANLPSDGGIISSGAYRYHNDILLQLFINKFKN